MRLRLCLLLLALCAAFSAAGQSTVQVSRKCPGASPSPARAKIEVEKDGDLAIVPCSGRTITTSGGNAFSGTVAVTRTESKTGDLGFNYGITSAMRIGGSSTNGTTTAFVGFAENTGDTGGSMTVTGVVGQANANRPTTAAILGGDFWARTGGNGSSPVNILYGVRGRANAGHNGAHGTTIGGFFSSGEVGGGGVGSITNVTAIQAQVDVGVVASTTNVTSATGLYLTGWTGPATNGLSTVTTSYGIRADNSIDIGSTRWFINSTSTSPSFFAGKDTFDVTNTAGGTTGNQTINKPSFSVNFAAATASLTVTNSFITANSYVLCTVQTNDATALLKNATPAAGSVVIRLNANTTAETRVACLVVN